MATTSRLNRALRTSFTLHAFPYYNINVGRYSRESVCGDTGLYSKFINVKVKNSDNTFELPLCGVKTFYDKLRTLVDSGNFVESNGEVEVLTPVHCNNSSSPYRAGTLDTGFIDCLYIQMPFGVTKVNIVSSTSIEPKTTFYQAPGLLLNEAFKPLFYCTIAGKYTINNEYVFTECRVYVAHRVFNQDDAISKFILKKVVPFYLNNSVELYKFRIPSDIKPGNGWNLRDGGELVKVKVILDPLDNLILDVKTPQSYEELEGNAYTKLCSPGAVDEMFNLDDSMFT